MAKLSFPNGPNLKTNLEDMRRQYMQHAEQRSSLAQHPAKSAES
jgi:hypothetical protein